MLIAPGKKSWYKILNKNKIQKENKHIEKSINVTYIRRLSLFKKMYESKTLIILLATVALTLFGTAPSGISLLQQVNAATSGQKGMDGYLGPDPYAVSHHACDDAACGVQGGAGGLNNNGNQANSYNGNGGNGGDRSV